MKDNFSLTLFLWGEMVKSYGSKQSSKTMKKEPTEFSESPWEEDNFQIGRPEIGQNYAN